MSIVEELKKMYDSGRIPYPSGPAIARWIAEHTALESRTQAAEATTEEHKLAMSGWKKLAQAAEARAEAAERASEATCKTFAGHLECIAELESRLASQPTDHRAVEIDDEMVIVASRAWHGGGNSGMRAALAAVAPLIVEQILRKAGEAGAECPYPVVKSSGLCCGNNPCNLEWYRPCDAEGGCVDPATCPGCQAPVAAAPFALPAPDTERKLAEETPNDDDDIYKVEVDPSEPGCECCDRGKHYIVVGPDDIAEGTSYESDVDADEMRWALDHAYRKGRAAAERKLEQANEWSRLRGLDIITLGQEIGGLERKLAMAVVALGPFAEFADSLNERIPNDIAIGIFADSAMRFGPSGGANVGSLRNASAALSDIGTAPAETAGDGWIEWHGGKQPLGNRVVVDLKFKNGRIYTGISAGNATWGYRDIDEDIIAYRVSPRQAQTERNGNE